MELNKISYKFKISITLKEYNRALTFLESISTHIEELSQEDVELIKILKKGLLRENSESLKKIRNEFNKSNKFIYKIVLDDYSETLHNNSINLIENFINLINDLFLKVKEEVLISQMYIIRAKLFSFLYEYHDQEEKSKNLQIAYQNYKTAVEIMMRDKKSKDEINSDFIKNENKLSKFKIFYSYCKFLSKFMNDKFRSVLFAINVIDEIHTIKAEEEAIIGEGDNYLLSNTPEFVKIEKKFRLFYENNLDDYNKVITLYHPEFK